MKAAQADRILERTRAEAKSWLSIVVRYRPHLSWTDVARIINRERTRSERIHVTTPKAQVRRLVRAGDLPEQVLDRARSPTREAVAIIAQRVRAKHPGISLRALVAKLDGKGIHQPRGHRWSPETVRRLLEISQDRAWEG